MQLSENTQISPRLTLPVTLLAALAQGVLLCGLREAYLAHVWPATDTAWLVALYSIAVFVPATVQLMASQVRKPASWALIALLALALAGFGWHHGAEVSENADEPDLISLSTLLLVWWLMVLPFLQSRLAAGRWTADYRLLFMQAWRNTLSLAEAALFTGLFSLLLRLWQTLFSMLGIHFFEHLFAAPAFAYPVTALVFGGALYLTGSIDTLVSVALGHLLNVLKWLAVPAGVLVTAFTLALIPKLPDLVWSGERAISATWLLWLAAVVILLLNAAYRDGTQRNPYPVWIAQSLRFAQPLLLVVAAAALYSLGVRAHTYGLTVSRVWAFVVAGAALLYCAGYTFAALRPGPWLAQVAPVNVGVALVLITVLTAGLTPLLSPYRLAADSQVANILQDCCWNQDAYLEHQRVDDELNYLHYSTGAYGIRRLQQLAVLHEGTHAPQIRRLAKTALTTYMPPPATPAQQRAHQARQVFATLPLYPTGRTLPAELAQKLETDWSDPVAMGSMFDEQAAAGVFVDLDGDGIEEFVLLGSSCDGIVYKKRSGRWTIATRLQMQGLSGDMNYDATSAELRKALSGGGISARPAHWRVLHIGKHVFMADE